MLKLENRKVRSLGGDRRGGAFALILIVILVVAAVLIFPKVVSGEPFSFEGVWEDFVNFFGGLFGGGETGYIGVGFTIHFKDGSTVDYWASPKFQMSPMSITVENKEVESIDIFVRAKMTEDVGVWSATVSQQIEMYLKPETTPRYSSMGYFTEGGVSWGADVVEELAVTSLSWDVIDDVVAGHGAASWHFQVNVEVDLEAEIDGVNQEFDGLAPSGGFELRYVDESSNPSMSVTAGSKPIA